MHNFKEQKGACMFGDFYICIIVFSCLTSTKPCLRFLLNCLFQGHNERFPKYLGWKLKFQKTETRFCRWKSNDLSRINVFLSLENPCTFLLTKEKTWKRTFNINSELSQNRTEKQIVPFKTTVNWLFDDMWCYLVIVFFIKKLAFSSKQ